jgi:hypothetical protein
LLREHNWRPRNARFVQSYAGSEQGESGNSVGQPRRSRHKPAVAATNGPIVSDCY